MYQNLYQIGKLVTKQMDKLIILVTKLFRTIDKFLLLNQKPKKGFIIFLKELRFTDFY